MPLADLALLRRVAVERSIREGGRPSVSDVLRGLVEKHRAELEAEATR
jgi:predicted CopG family antitoxin